MKRINEKRICSVLAAILLLVAVFTFGVSADGDSPSISDAANKVKELIDSFRAPVLAIVGAAGGLYCILLGVKYAKAEEPQDREKAKAHLKNAIIGFVLIFVLIVALSYLLPVLSNWVEDNELSNELSR